MRILYMTHFYPPAPCGGAGYYTAALAENFGKAGHETRVLCAGRWQEGGQHFGGFDDDVCSGVSVRRLHLNWRLAPQPFDYLYDNPRLDEAVQLYLNEYQPDIVHITSCITLSARVISIVKKSHVPVVVHLVDYWFICPLHTLLRKDRRVCFGGKDAWECQSCLLYGSKADRWSKAVLSESARSFLFSRLGRIPMVTRLPGLIGLLGDMARRRRYTLQSLCVADAVIAPSQTLLDLYVRNGMPRHRIDLLLFGHDIQWATGVQRGFSSQLRLGYLGNILPIKGVHVLLEAFASLSQRDDVSLHIYGNDAIDVTYADRLKSNLPANVFWHGAYQRDQLASILSNIDVLVVPSVWHENRPLVIQEGFAAGCPVIVSDLGGMAEAVADGVNGLHFRRGDSVHLAQQISRLAQTPNLLSQLRARIPKVKTIAEEIDEMGAVYAQVTKRQTDTSG